MKYLIATLLLCTFCLGPSASLRAQNVGLNFSIGIRKTFKLNKKSSLDLRQQLQLTPEIKQYDNRYGDFFNEEGFWAVPDRYERPDDDDDDDDDDLPPGASVGVPNNPGEINDAPVRIDWEWRSNTSLQYNYMIQRWLRVNTGYALFYNGEEFRHTFRAELDYRPLRHSKSRKKVDIAARTLYQYAGQPDDGRLEWDPTLVPRVDAEWTFKKNHILALSNALNGVWDDDIFRFDRWRMSANLVFIYSKIHRFTFGYQFQQRLDKPRKSHGFSLGYEIRI
jgi:hypothetical protein